MEIEGEKKGRARFIVMNFVRVLLAVAIIGSYLNRRWLVLLVSGISLLITFLPRILDKVFGIIVPADLEVMIILFVYGSLFFGEVRGFYADFWWWGALLNLIAGTALGIVGLTILFALYKREQLDASPTLIAIFTFCFGLAMGTLWEFFEFGMDHFFQFSLQKGGLYDTIYDLMFDSVGALIAAVIGYNYLQGGNVNIISKYIVNFVEKNPFLFKSKKTETSEDKIKNVINSGERDKVEFKSTLRVNLHTKELDRKIEHSVLKTICAFLNSHGGKVLIGVGDKGEICGIEKDNFENIDKFQLHLTNLIKSHLGREFFHFIKIDVEKVGDKNVAVVECGKSDKPAFLKFNQEEEFFIRSGPASVKLDGSLLVDYINRRFRRD